MFCIVGCQEKGVSGEGADAVTQAPSCVLHPKTGPGNKTLYLPQILDSTCSRAKVTSKQGQRKTPWPRFFLFTWVFYTFNVYSPVGNAASYWLSHRKKNKPQVICMMNSPSALISAACLQLHSCALNLENIFNFQNSFDMGKEEGTAENNTLQIKFGTIQDFFHLRRRIL